MIQTLRTVHRHSFVALAFVLPVVMVVGLANRHPRRLSSKPTARVPRSEYMARKSQIQWSRHGIRTELHGDSTRRAETDVVLHPTERLNEPDLLLYWSADPAPGDTLPANARLVGPLIAGKSMVLPPGADRSGFLVLFSLPHQSVFDTAKLEKLP
jgi:hypothetical protein